MFAYKHVIAASTPGSKHGYREEQNQDVFAVLRFPEGVAMAVCDGAGSHSNSRLGANAVSEAAVSFLSGLDWSADFQSQVTNFLSNVPELLSTKAAELSLTVRDFSCTLLALSVSSHGVRALQLGDGFIVIRDRTGSSYELMFPMTKGEYINETVFVTRHDAAKYLQIHASNNPPDFICLSTDGLERQAIVLAESRPHAPFFDYLAKLAASDAGQEYLEKFLVMPELNAATDDDRTLVCAHGSIFGTGKEL